MTSARWLIAMIALAALSGACRPADPGAAGDGEVVVLAAASMTDVVTEIAAAFTSSSGRPVRCSFAASSTLARQIEAGARADVFISADVAWMERLADADLLDAPAVDVAGNRLVLVVPSADANGMRHPPVDPARADDLTAITGRIAVGDPAHVPAGRYARAALEHLGAWSEVEPRLVATVDVRAALRLAQLDEVDAAIVYASDAAVAGRVSVAAIFGAGAHPPIRYPAAALRGADEDARRFLAALREAPARRLLRTAGFTVPDTAP